MTLYRPGTSEPLSREETINHLYFAGAAWLEAALKDSAPMLTLDRLIRAFYEACGGSPLFRDHEAEKAFREGAMIKAFHVLAPIDAEEGLS